MGWKRLPTHFVNFPLRLLPLTKAQEQTLQSTGHLSQAAFQTTPSVGKVNVSLQTELLNTCTWKLAEIMHGKQKNVSIFFDTLMLERAIS